MGSYFSKTACPADDGEGWKRYLTVQEQESVLQEAQLIQQGCRPECHRKREGSAIFWAPGSEFAIRCKLAEILVALENGMNPNEEESQPMLQLRSGRPLDLCLNDSKAMNSDTSLLNNIPVIQMLLDYGADPRLDPIPIMKGACGLPLKPIEEVQNLAKFEEPGPMKRFYEEAYLVLKKATDRLNSK